MRHLHHSLSASRDGRIGVSRRLRPGDGEFEHVCIVVRISAQVGLDHRGEYAGHELDLAQLARLHDVAHRFGVAREVKRVAHHQVKPVRLRPLDQVPRFVGAERHRLLDHDTDAGIESVAGNLVVVGVLDGDYYAVDAGGQKFPVVGVLICDVVVVGCARQLVLFEVGDSDQLGVLVGLQAGNVELSRPPARADHAHSRFAHLSPPTFRPRRRDAAWPRRTRLREGGRSWRPPARSLRGGQCSGCLRSSYACRDAPG